MDTQCDQALLSLPPDRWQARQVIVLDWYDGPREGLCEMTQPACCFHFTLLAEQRPDNDLDDRLFRLSTVSQDAITQVFSILQELGPPSRPVWIPRWSFNTDLARQVAENRIEELLHNANRTKLIVRTPDMIRFLNCWIDVSQ